MSNENRILMLENRINLLRNRHGVDNSHIISKMTRELRKLRTEI